MKLTELLVSIAIFSLILASSFYAYSTCLRSCKQIVYYSKENAIIAKYDLKFRNRISNIEIPYWQNYENASLLLAMQIEDEYSNQEEVKIKRIEKMKNSDNKTYGLKIVWMCSEKEYETVEKFKTKNIYIKK